MELTEKGLRNLMKITELLIVRSASESSLEKILCSVLLLFLLLLH